MTYNPEADVLMIRIAKGQVAYGEQHGDVIAHYSKDGKIVELEVLGARRNAVQLLEAILAEAPGAQS